MSRARREIRLAVVVLAALAATQAAADAPPVADAESQLIRRTDADTAPAPSAGATPPVTHNGLDLTRVALALGLVLLIILALHWLGRRFFWKQGGSRGNRVIHVVSRSVISPRQQVLLMQVGRRLVVVADGPTGMSPLCEITDPDEVAALIGQAQSETKDSAGRTFAELFGRAERTFESSDTAETQPAETDSRPAVDEEPAIRLTRQELSGLMEKVRVMSRQFHRT